MSASIWEPGAELINIDAESTNRSQVFTATAAQTVFTLTTFSYTLYSGAVAVYRGGQRLILGVDWIESSSDSITLTGIILESGEVIEVVAVLGSASVANIAANAAAASAAASALAAQTSGSAIALASALAAPSGASLVGYLPSGTVQSKLRELPNARDKGAALDGVTDDTAALQACLDDNRVYVIDGPARITSDLIIDPIRNRNCGFIAPTTLASRYPTTTQSGGPTWTGQGEARIFYDGVVSDSACVVRASAESVGVEPVATFANTIWSMTLDNVTLDANNKAGYGLYAVRVQDIQLQHVRARGATVAGFSINGSYSGSIESCRAYLNPGRGFELGAADDRWGWTAQDKINALYIRDLHADANGSDSTFREASATLKKANCGVYFGPHRGVTISGVVSENNFGANIVFEPTSTGNKIDGFYTELGCKYAPGGAGTDAISLGYATKQWGVIFIGATDAIHNRLADGVCGIDAIWLTGTEPSAARQEGGFELYNVSLASEGLTADWSNYRLVNCALELETITGSQPVGAMSIKGGIQFGSALDNLNHYDEGTWTPAFAGTTIPGAGWAYSVQAGEFTRIGRHVFFCGRISLSAVSADATGQIAVTGLPFTVKNANGANASVQISAAVNLATAVVQLDGNVTINNTRFTLQKRTAANVSASSVVLADLSSTTTITFSGHYAV